MIMVEFFTLQDEACRMAADAMHNAAVERAMYVCMTVLGLCRPSTTASRDISREGKV
jgi:hypothetical protein